MIFLQLQVSNPWYHGEFKNIWCKSSLVSKNKAWEVQFSHYGYDLLGFTFKFDWRGTDHAGPLVRINIFGYTLESQIYDTRHWDYEKNCWETYENTTGSTTD